MIRWALICISVWLISLAPHRAAFAQGNVSPRTVTSLNEAGWQFRFGDAPDGVKAAGFDDSKWERIALPHTWNRVSAGLLKANITQGIGWYRLSYDAKPVAKRRRLYIDFAAVGNVADVWVNGAHVGQHKGAFTRFRFDVTPQWKPGAKNLIVVRADNSKPAVGSTTEHVIPLADDFSTHGGIYRGVQLIEANDVGIDLLDFGGPGVYVELGEFAMIVGHRDPGGILIYTTTRLRNLSSKPRKIDFQSIIRDPQGQIVAEGVREQFLLKPGSTDALLGEQKIVSPSPWDGVKSQKLYTISVEIRESERLIDSVTQSFGIRDFKFDPNTGLTLNGKPLKLRGVSRHQDKLGKGWALTPEDHAEDMAIMKEMGVNTVRHAHDIPADEWLAAANKAGMMVWADVPYATPTSLPGEGSTEIFANAEQQTREAIRQTYNHPSIVMWTASNGVDAPTLSPALQQHINRIIKEEASDRDVRPPLTWMPLMFDASSDDVNGRGLVSFDRKIKTDAFYYYKANWSSEYFIHITGENGANPASSQIDVKAYTSEKRAQLQVGAKDYGEIDCPNHVCVWKGVALSPGPNDVTVFYGELADKAVFTGPTPVKGIRINAGDTPDAALNRHCEQSEAIESNTPVSVACRASLTVTKRGGAPAMLNPVSAGKAVVAAIETTR